MEEVKVIDLENGTFVITDEILINGIKYVAFYINLCYYNYRDNIINKWR